MSDKLKQALDTIANSPRTPEPKTVVDGPLTFRKNDADNSWSVRHQRSPVIGLGPSKWAALTDLLTKILDWRGDAKRD